MSEMVGVGKKRGAIIVDGNNLYRGFEYPDIYRVLSLVVDKVNPIAEFDSRWLCLDEHNPQVVEEGRMLGFEPMGIGNADYCIKRGIEGILKGMPELDFIALGSGDSDFLVCCDLIREYGKSPIIVSWEDKISSRYSHGSHVMFIFKEEIEQRKRDIVTKYKVKLKEERGRFNPLFSKSEAEKILYEID